MSGENRPPCPACKGTRVMGNKHPRPCTCCDDGKMRGVTDETPEERRIAALTQTLTEIAAAWDLFMHGGPADTIMAISEMNRLLGKPVPQRSSDRSGDGQ